MSNNEMGNNPAAGGTSGRSAAAAQAPAAIRLAGVAAAGAERRRAEGVAAEAGKRRLEGVMACVREVNALAGLRSVSELKAFLRAGHVPDHMGDLSFMGQSVRATTATLVRLQDGLRIKFRLRLQTVAGEEHLFLKEQLYSPHEMVLEALDAMHFPRALIPRRILAELQRERSPYANTRNVSHWIFLLSQEFHPFDLSVFFLPYVNVPAIWVDVDEMRAVYTRYLELKRWNITSRQERVKANGTKLNSLANVLRGGPANTVGSMLSGPTRALADQGPALLARLAPPPRPPIVIPPELAAIPVEIIQDIARRVFDSYNREFRGGGRTTCIQRKNKRSYTKRSNTKRSHTKKRR